MNLRPRLKFVNNIARMMNIAIISLVTIINPGSSNNSTMSHAHKKRRLCNRNPLRLS